MSTQPYPHVVIAGAGLGGLALAQTLRKQGISYEVFEKGSSVAEKSHAWCIGIHTMLPDLIASIPDDMPSLDMRSSDPDGSRIGVTGGGDNTVPVIRANRPKLWQWLETNIPVQYNKKVEKITEAGGKATLYFEDGTSATGDMVVGADGTHSRVRQYLLEKTGVPDPFQPIPTASLNGELVLTGQDFADQLNLAHSGWVLFNDNKDVRDTGAVAFKGLMRVSEDGKTGYFYWVVTALDKDHRWIRQASREELRAVAMEKIAAFAPPGELRVPIEKTPLEGFSNKPVILYSGTLDPKDVPSGRVLLLGDAVHPMPPARGEGGTVAMMDALDLGRAIGKLAANKTSEESLLEITDVYNRLMMERGNKSAKASAGSLKADVAEPREVWGATAIPTPRSRVTIPM